MNNRTSSSLTPRDYDGPHLHIPLDFVDWSEPGSPEPTYAVSLKRLPEPWEPLVCQLRNVVIDPELFTIEVTAFGFQRSFEWNPDKPTIEFAIPWGYMGLRSDEEFETLAVLLRNKQTGRGTYLELSWTYLYRNAIPQQLPSVLAPTPPAPTQALCATASWRNVRIGSTTTSARCAGAGDVRKGRLLFWNHRRAGRDGL